MNVIERLSASSAPRPVDGAAGDQQRQGSSCCLAGHQARRVLKALADPIRLQVVEALAGGERCVCELTAELGLAQSKLSFHLRVLKEAGLLVDRQQGRWTYCRLESGVLRDLRAWLDQLIGCCSQTLQEQG